MLQDIQTWKQDTKAFEEAIYISVLGVAQWIHSHPKAEPQKQRGLALYTLASRLQKQEARTYMVVWISIVYFILSVV
jgi:hypothetical protein